MKLSELQLQHPEVLFQGGRPTLQCICYSKPHGGKTTFATTWPGPLLVWFFDSQAKMAPYLRLGDPKKTFVDWETPFPSHPDFQLKHVIVCDSEENVKARIICFAGKDRTVPRLAYDAFEQELMRLLKEEARVAFAQRYKTIVLDTFTWAEQSAILQAAEQNPLANKKMKWDYRWAGHAAEKTRDFMMNEFRLWTEFNILVLGHEGQEVVKQGDDVIRGFLCYGKVLVNRIGGTTGEYYHMQVTRDAEGQPQYQLQTREADGWAAGSCIQAPDPCEPTYEALWANYHTEWVI